MAGGLLEQAQQLGIQPRARFFDPSESGTLMARYAGQMRETAAAQELEKQVARNEDLRRSRFVNDKEEEEWRRQQEDLAEKDAYDIERGQFLHEFARGIDPEADDYEQKLTEFLANAPKAALDDDALKSMIVAKNWVAQKRLTDKQRDEARAEQEREIHIRNISPYLQDPEDQKNFAVESLKPGFDPTPWYAKAHERKLKEAEGLAATKAGFRIREKQLDYERKNKERLTTELSKLSPQADPQITRLFHDPEGLSKLEKERAKLEELGRKNYLDYNDDDLSLDRNAFANKAAAIYDTVDWQNYYEREKKKEDHVPIEKGDTAAQNKRDEMRSLARKIWDYNRAVAGKEFVDRSRQMDEEQFGKEGSLIIEQEGVPLKTGKTGEQKPPMNDAEKLKAAEEWIKQNASTTK